MKAIATALVILLTSSGVGLAHEEERRVEIEPESNAPIQSVDHKFRFQLLDTKTKKLLATTDLKVSHEKKLHFLAYDSALKEFQHVHPEFDGEFWRIDLRFNVSGTYWLWAQGVLNDGEEFSAPTDTKVMLEGKPGWPLPPRLTDARSGAEGVSKVTLSNTKLFANKMAMVTVKMSRTDGSKPQITPYLGAFAHVIAVTDDADSLIHVHPMNGSKPEEGMLHATFPRKGLYRLWIQVLDGGQLRTIPLSVSVAP
jgi:hypothetical protein